MKRFHANVGSRNPALQQRPEVLKAVGMYAAIYVLSRVVNDLMSVLAGQSLIRKQGVSIKSRASSDMLAYFILQYLATTTRNHAGTNLAAAFHDSNDSGF